MGDDESIKAVFFGHSGFYSLLPLRTKGKSASNRKRTTHRSEQCFNLVLEGPANPLEDLTADVLKPHGLSEVKSIRSGL
jgi:hypothetical protein